MESPIAPIRGLVEGAALARIDEVGARSVHPQTGRRDMKTAGQDRELKEAVRGMWALGDYHRFATETVWQVGPELVAACSVAPGQRVLDVAAGTGNVAIRAAEAGAEVVAVDLTPENFDAGRREARARGVELEWVEGDAEDLPFGSAEFDVVTSSFGAMFAPDHQAVADELVRVCRPGGTVGMANFTAEGLAGAFFGVFAQYAPEPPPDALPPLLWGDEEHVRQLFGNRVGTLELSRREYVEAADSPEGYCELLKEAFGPAIAIRAGLEDEPERAAAFDRDLLAFATGSSRGAPGGRAEYPYEYLLVVARTRSAGGS